MSETFEAEDDLPPVPDGGLVKLVPVINRRGLHARASAKFVKMAAQFDAEVTVTRDGQTVDAQSIMGLMMLAAGQGSCIEIAAEGTDAEAAVNALAALVADRFNEDR